MLWTAIAAVVSAVGMVLFAVYCNHIIKNCEKFCYQDIQQLPVTSNDDPDPVYDTALLLGAAKTSKDGYPNLYYYNRIETAAELFKAGKIRHIIISGDNGRKNYSETDDMKNDLIKSNVPETALTLDHAGFRTLDSVVRARDVFNQNKLVIISQQYHLPRAIYIARKHGIDAIGFVAAEQQDLQWLKKRNHNREILARIAAWLDVNILHRKPKFQK